MLPRKSQNPPIFPTTNPNSQQDSQPNQPANQPGGQPPASQPTSQPASRVCKFIFEMESPKLRTQVRPTKGHPQPKTIRPYVMARPKASQRFQPGWDPTSDNQIQNKMVSQMGARSAIPGPIPRPSHLLQKLVNQTLKRGILDPKTWYRGP